MMKGIAGIAGLVVLSAVCLCETSFAAVTMETVTVGNAGNPADQRYPHVEIAEFGRVDYTYNIGKYEVTTGQYTAFLNAVAATTDPYELYNEQKMWLNTGGCKIERSGSPGSYSYSVADDWANRPVNCVSWGCAVRFANWLHNGQPTGPQGSGTTEDGSYFINGAMTSAELLTITRESDATWALPTQDEWYKAAYHKNDGVTGNYFDYPTSSDAEPSNNLIDPDPGNNATFIHEPDPGEDNPYTIGGPYYRTEVGAHENSTSPYGTFDQGGNVIEWTEGIEPFPLEMGYGHAIRGGDFAADYMFMHARGGGAASPAIENSPIGFRVCQVPEPGTICMLALGALGLFHRRR